MDPDQQIEALMEEQERIERAKRERDRKEEMAYWVIVLGALLVIAYLLATSWGSALDRL